MAMYRRYLQKEPMLARALTGRKFLSCSNACRPRHRRPWDWMVGAYRIRGASPTERYNGLPSCSCQSRRGAFGCQY